MLATIVHALQKLCDFDRNSSGRNLRLIGIVGHCACVWRLQTDWSDRTHERGDGAIMRGPRSTLHAIRDGRSVINIRRVVDDDLSAYLLAESIELGEIAHHDRFGGNPF